ncbi:ovochymase-2-like [Sitodiplosis mosellana]|uniref:ovochymase-2-like n=1 Tax=Sitodiplosis mosellana TaxID=263140 RepID=UPI00244507D7|nr:ovochymase-2-like [Sitodiplosis mosellana]
MGHANTAFNEHFQKWRLVRNPWRVEIHQFDRYRCNGVLLSTKHLLTTTKCILPYKGVPAENSNGDELPISFWLRYTLIHINSKIKRKARYVYIHPEHQCNPNELLPAIVEMNESIEFDKWTQPAVLPPTALQIHERILPVAISYTNISVVTTNKMNVMIYSDEICERMNPGENGNRLLCIDIESICSDCNICEFGIFTDPLFHLAENDTMLLLGLAKHCNRTAKLINVNSGLEEQRSSAVYMPIGEFLPWIHNIMHKTCPCETTYRPLIQDVEAIIFEKK